MMNSNSQKTSFQVVSLVEHSGELKLLMSELALAPLQPDEVCVRVEAAPINPSDMGLMFAGADLSTAHRDDSPQPAVRATVPAGVLAALRHRIGVPMPTGLEGAGVVVAAGTSPEAQQLVGRTVALMAGGMYAQFRIAKTSDCLVLPIGVTPREAASCFVNPLTALGMVETMRREGHSALVHTAAASSLGQILNRVCLADKIPLVCVVRSPAQEQLLRQAGAQYVCNSESPGFVDALIEAVAATGATIAFDATGGGSLAGQILSAMEAAVQRQSSEYGRYGSSVHKQLYFFGGLDPRPVEFRRVFGMAWGMGGWLLNHFLERIGRDAQLELKSRVAAQALTTFSTQYAKEISLAQVLEPSEIAVYGSRATGGKYLVNPSLSLS